MRDPCTMSLRSQRGAAAGRVKQRGAAALLVTMLLFFAMVLAVLFSNRTLLTEQRRAAQDVRASQAFEAAEAGLEWGLAQLNRSAPIDARCQVSTQPGAMSLRARTLATVAGSAAATPPTETAAARAGAVAACTRTSSGWACHCPEPEQLAQPPDSDATPGTAFVLTIEPAEQRGMLQLHASGCAAATACQPGAPQTADATTQLEVALGALPALAHPPLAAVTVRTGFDAQASAVGVHNLDPASGLGVLAGGAIDARRARLTPPPGSATAGMLVAHDAALGRLSAAQLFVSVFGVDKALWRDQSDVVKLHCQGPCGAAVAAAAAASPGASLVWIDGDVSLQGPLTLGTAEHPVVLVVDGAAQLDGAVSITGMLYASTLNWEHAGGATAVLRGAAVSEGTYRGHGEPDFVYDAQVLAALQRQPGSYARVRGSWREL